jgi:hypothetical protein
MALCGLRMMPRFPSPSLRFRKAGFPRYGSKAGISGAAFPAHAGLPSPFVLSAANEKPPRCVGDRCAYQHLRASGPAALPQGPSLRSGLCCPGPSTLSRPHPPQLPAHSDFTVSRLIRNAIAVHAFDMPRQPTTGSELSLMLFRNMSSSETTGNPSVAYPQYFTEGAGLQLLGTVSAFPSSSHSDSGEEPFSRLNYGSLALQPVALLAPLSEQTGFAPSLRGRLLPGFRRFGHPRRRRI